MNLRVRDSDFNELPDVSATEEPLLKIVGAREFADEEEAGAEPLADDGDGGALIPAGGLVLVYGGAGVGKTTMMLDLTVHLATARPWLNGLVRASRPLRVLLCENEGPRVEFRKKLRAKLEDWPDAAEQIDVFEAPWGEFSFRNERQRDALATWVAVEGIDLLVVGPLRNVGMVGAGTLGEVEDFLKLVVKLQQRVETLGGGRLAVAIVHHENRAGQTSGAWEGLPDLLLHATTQGKGRMRLHFQKARWSSSRHEQKVVLAWDEGESYTLVEDEQAATDETLWERVADFVGAHGGCTWTALRKSVAGKADRLATIRNEMLDAGVLVNLGAEGRFVLWHRDDPDVPLDDLPSSLLDQLPSDGRSA